MTILNIHGYTSLHIRMSFLLSLKYYVKGFKMIKVYVSFLSKVTIRLSLRMLSSNYSMKRMVFSTTSLHPENSFIDGVVERKNKTL